MFAATDFSSLVGPAASIITIISVLGGGAGVFFFQIRRGSAEARSSLIQEQQTAINFLEGELRREREARQTAEVAAAAAEKHVKTLRADNAELRKLISLEAVPPALQKALEDQATKIMALIKETHGP